MIFNSWEFALFFPLVTVLYFVLPHKFRWMLLLLASCLFYMTFIPVYILILLFTIVVDYFAGIFIEKSEGHRRKVFLTASIIVNVGALVFFKYFNFINGNMLELARLVHWNYPIGALNIILPIGLSFHTFQAMSYTIEVYRGKQKAEKHFGIYSLYVMFYPQLVAGPIERPQNLIHQFMEEHKFEYSNVTEGLKLMAWGLFKKVAIADRLAIDVNRVYAQPLLYPGLPSILATIFFAFQIYCDFSGYSDIAIGAARVMGFKLMQNFNKPYFSGSISEFWKRWHISLSTWFRDYLYIPLGGSRVAKWRWQFNIFIVFLLSGLWHGANWTYVVWGALNGIYLIFSGLTENVRKRLVAFIGLDSHPGAHKLLRVAITFSLICVAWVFFRAKNIQTASFMLGHFADVFKGFPGIHWFKETAQITARFGMRSSFFSIIFIVGVEFALLRYARQIHAILQSSTPLRWAVYYSLGFSILLFDMFSNSQFIYFQF